MTKKTLQNLPDFKTDPHFITEAELSDLVKKSVHQIALLEKQIEKTPPHEEIATALIRQKKIFSVLKNAAGKGYALAGLGVMQAIAITGTELERLFDYVPGYPDNRGATKLRQFIRLQNLIPILQKYNTFEKTENITGFACNLPNLKEQRFSSALYEALNAPHPQSGLSFNQTFFQTIAQETQEKPENPIDIRLQKRTLNVLRISAQKGYPGAILVYSRYLIKQGNLHEATPLLKKLTLNKFATPDLHKQAQQMIFSGKILTTHILSQQKNAASLI